MAPEAQEFSAEVERAGGRTFVRLPFDADSLWGEKDRHYVTGEVGGRSIRARIEVDREGSRLPLGPAWLRDSDVGPGQRVRVRLEPEGPRQGNLPEDVEAALRKEPDARRYFDSLATFYRRNYIRWLEAAKRPETRAKRLEEMVSLLKQGIRQR